VEPKETKPRFVLVVKEEVTPPVKIFKKMRPLLEKFKRVVHNELPKELSPMRDTPHHNDLIWEAKLLTLPYY